jgi:predicted enzyme related to lactoylglutathione lyase
MFRGVETVTFYTDDLKKASAWYAKALGQKPYFETDFYVGFSVNGYELGLHPTTELSRAGTNGQVAYWSVDSVKDAVAHLEKHGAKLAHELQDVGEGIVIASVRDPFGNLFGVIQNPKSPNKKK